MGLFTSRPFLVSNAFYLLTFPLNALGAIVAFRWRRVARPLAVLGAAVFGILPLHFMKGIDYLFFVSSYMVPISCAMVIVFGSRTVQTFIWDGANMGLFLRWGKWFMAKLIEASFGTNYLSDVGCTFRVMRRNVVEEMLPRFYLTGSAFGLELLLRAVDPGGPSSWGWR